MLATGEKIRDRTPEIRAAGKLIPRGGGAKECLVIHDGEKGSPKTPDTIQRFRMPGPGESRVLNTVGSLDKDLRHGVKTKSSLDASDLVSPPRITRFEKVCADQQEDIYGSKKKAPLGSAHTRGPGLPKGMDPLSTSFGQKNVKTESAGDSIRPQKTTLEVEEEFHAGRELYKKSHNDWDVGEMIDRGYDWSKFSKGSLYGVPTPHDNTGSGANLALHWQGKPGIGGEVVSKRLDDFREKTQPQLGQVHDPIAETLTVDEDHTFGIMVKPDDFNAGDLVHSEAPSVYQEALVFDSGVLASVRNHLKKNNFCNFAALLEALQHKDQDNNGKLLPVDVDEIFFLFKVPLTPEMFQMLMRWCGDDSGIAYSDMLTLMNWKWEPDVSVLDRVATVSGETSAPPETLLPPLLMSNYRTSAQTVQTVGNAPLSTGVPHGVPSIRTDLPAPKIKRVGDHTNYGDESDAYGVIYPSIYSNKAVYENDFFQPRDKDIIRSVFDKIGVRLSDDVFQELWTEAQRKDPKGQVSIESFRTLLEEVQANQQAKNAFTN